MRIGSCVIAVLLAATSALAHHSNSAFDGDKVMVLTGTVTEWKWTNPHVWIFLSVDDGNGGKASPRVPAAGGGTAARPRPAWPNGSIGEYTPVKSGGGVPCARSDAVDTNSRHRSAEENTATVFDMMFSLICDY